MWFTNIRVNVVSSRWRIVSDYSHRLTQPALLEDGRPPRILSTILYSVVGFIIAAVAWSSWFEVEESTIASGQIVPRGELHAIQHLEGGIVAELLAHEGQLVAAGQPLVRLEPVSATSDRDQLESRRAALRIQLLRLDAEAKDDSLNLGDLNRSHPLLAAEQARLFSASTLHRLKERATLTSRVAIKKNDAAVIARDLETATRQLEVSKEQYEIQGVLITKGLTSRIRYLETRAQLVRIEGEISSLTGRLGTAREAIIEAENALAESDANAVRRNAEEKAKATNELTEVEEQLQKFKDRVQRLYVRSPSVGYVQELTPKAIGEVVRPADTIAKIVPSGPELVAEIRIEGRDRGHVRNGAPASIKFKTYDSTLFGVVKGTVEYVSATTFSPPPSASGPSEPHYKAIIRLGAGTVGQGAMTRPIIAGLAVQAQINTGSRSIMRYMLKPIYASLESAFRER